MDTMNSLPVARLPGGAGVAVAVQNIDSDKTFFDVLEQHEDILIAFLSEKCGVCDMFKPVLQAFGEFAASPAAKSKVKVVSVDVDVFGGIADYYEVKRIPTLVFLHKTKGGFEKRDHEGGMGVLGVKRFVWPLKSSEK